MRHSAGRVRQAITCQQTRDACTPCFQDMQLLQNLFCGAGAALGAPEGHRGFDVKDTSRASHPSFFVTQFDENSRGGGRGGGGKIANICQIVQCDMRLICNIHSHMLNMCITMLERDLL